jgi:hypothetical protein
MAGTGDVQNTLDVKQIMFDLNNKSVWYWRRALLLKYYIDLGKQESVHITWLDYDKSPNEIVLHDEEQPFEEKSQSASLNKSVVQIFYKVSKLITISIYYTTKRCLVQGNTCQNWVDEEFKEIKECINTCLKGDNPKLNIDNNIRQMKEINIKT